MVWPLATVQLCVVLPDPRLAALRLQERLGPLTKDLRLIYTAVDQTTAETALEAFEQCWAARYAAIVTLHENQALHQGGHGRDTEAEVPTLPC